MDRYGGCCAKHMSIPSVHGERVLVQQSSLPLVYYLDLKTRVILFLSIVLQCASAPMTSMCTGNGASCDAGMAFNNVNPL